MQRVVFVVALGLGLAAFLGPSRAYAFGAERLHAHIPFAFDVNGTVLPAGNYIVRRADMLEPHVLEITSSTGKTGIFFMTEDMNGRHPVQRAELVFDRYGKQSFLREVRVPDQVGAELEEPPAEVHVARIMATAAPEKAHVAGSVK
jgi:hypothetical protein